MNQICRKPNEIIPFCEEWFGAGLNGFWGLYSPRLALAKERRREF